MSRSNKLVLLSLVVSHALASPQGQPYLPSSIEAQIYSIYPSEVPDNSYGSAYFSAHPAAYSTFEAKISSLEAANPSYFPTNGGNFFSQALTGIPDLGLSPTQSAEFFSAASAFAAPITGNPASYISQHPGAYSSYIAEASSILGSDFGAPAFPTGAGGAGGVGGAGFPTAPIFTMSPQGSQASQAGATARQSSAANTQVTSQVTLRTTQQATQQQQTASQASQTPAAFTRTGNRAAMQTPALAMGLSGAAVAAVAGIAALL